MTLLEICNEEGCKMPAREGFTKCVRHGGITGDEPPIQNPPWQDTPATVREATKLAPKLKRPKPRSRAARWNDAIASIREGIEDAKAALANVATQDLLDVREEYVDWLSNLDGKFAGSPLVEKLEAMESLDVSALEELADVLDAAEAVLDEAEGLDLPRGFGRD